MSEAQDATSQGSSHGTSGHLLGGASKASKYESVVFGVLYTMVKDNSSMPSFIRLLFVLVDTLQVIGLAFDSDVNWGSKPFQDIMRFANNPFYAFSASAVYVMYAFVMLALLLSFLNFYVVARDLMGGELSYMFPVKTLRFLCTIIITVCYMPFLNILLVFISCDGDHLRSVPDIKCWSLEMLIPGVLSLLMLLAFIPSAIVFRSVFFNSDPLSSDPLSRPLSRVDTIWLFFKTILVFTFRLSSSATAKAILLTGLALVILAMQLYTMPYYKKATNHLIAAAYSVNVATGAGMFVALSPAPPAVLYPVLAAAMLCCATVGVGLSEWRWRSLLSQALRKSTLAHEHDFDVEEVASPTQDILSVITSRKAGNLAGPEETQRLVRVALQSAAIDEDVAVHLESLFKYSIEKYPKHASLFVAYATFLTHYRRNTQLATVQNRKVLKLKPAFDVRFLSYCAERTIFEENQAHSQGEGRLDVLAFLEFQKMQAQAFRNHQETLEIMRKFWGALLADADRAELRALTVQLTAMQARATSAYSQIIKAFPNNKQIYRSAAAFYANVHYDYDTAQFFDDQADELEEDKGKDADKSSSRGSRHQGRRGLDYDEGSIAQHRAFREILKNRKSVAVEWLSRVSFSTILFLILLVIVYVIVMFVLLTQYEGMVKVMNLVFVRRNLLQSSLLLQTNLLVAMEHNVTEVYAASQAEFTTELNVFSSTHQELYELTYGTTAEMDEEWTLKQLEFVSAVENASTFMTNQKDGGVAFVLEAATLAETGMGELEDEQLSVDFVFANGYGDERTPWERGLSPDARIDPPKLGNTFERLTFLFTEYILGQIWSAVYIQLTIYIVAMILIVLLGCAGFRPALNRVREERAETFGLFLTIPKEIVAKVHDGIRIEESFKEKKTGKKSSGGSSGTREDASDSVDRTYRKRLFAAFVMIIVSCTVGMLVNVTLSLQFTGTPPILEDANRRSFLTYRTAFLVAALHPVADEHAPVRALGSLADLKADLRFSVDTLADTHLRFLTGGTNAYGRDVSGIGTGDKDQLYLTRQEVCLTNYPPCPDPDTAEFVGLEELLQFYVAQGRELSEMSHEELMEEELLPVNEVERLLPLLLQTLTASADMITQKSLAASGNGRINCVVLGVIIILLLILMYLLLFRPIVRNLSRESYRTSALLLMIPPELISEVDAVRTYLETGQLSRSGKEELRALETSREEGVGLGLRPSPSALRLHGHGTTNKVYQAEETSSGVLTALSRGQAYVVVDAHSKIVEASERLLRDTEYDASELKGASISVLFAPPMLNIKPLAVPSEPTINNVDETDDDTFGKVTPRTHNALRELAHAHARHLIGLAGSSNEMPSHPPVKLRKRSGVETAPYHIQLESAGLNGQPAVMAILTCSPCKCPQEDQSFSSGDYSSTEDEVLTNRAVELKRLNNTDATFSMNSFKIKPKSERGSGIPPRRSSGPIVSLISKESLESTRYMRSLDGAPMSSERSGSAPSSARPFPPKSPRLPRISPPGGPQDSGRGEGGGGLGGGLGTARK